MTRASDIIYKVVEVAPVVEETIERALNERRREGWDFQSIHFVMREGSHRPAMAYLFFTGRGTPPPATTGDPPERHA